MKLWSLTHNIVKISVYMNCHDMFTIMITWTWHDMNCHCLTAQCCLRTTSNLKITKKVSLKMTFSDSFLKYIKLLHLMRINELSFSEKHMSHSWQAWKCQIRSILHLFVLSHHVSCLQMNWKMNHSEIKSLFRTQEKRIYDASMLSEHQQEL